MYVATNKIKTFDMFDKIFIFIVSRLHIFILFTSFFVNIIIAPQNLFLIKFDFKKQKGKNKTIIIINVD